jgi:hypothetical protein
MTEIGARFGRQRNRGRPRKGGVQKTEIPIAKEGQDPMLAILKTRKNPADLRLDCIAPSPIAPELRAFLVRPAGHARRFFFGDAAGFSMS